MTVSQLLTRCTLALAAVGLVLGTAGLIVAGDPGPGRSTRVVLVVGAQVAALLAAAVCARAGRARDDSEVEPLLRQCATRLRWLGRAVVVGSAVGAVVGATVSDGVAEAVGVVLLGVVIAQLALVLRVVRGRVTQAADVVATRQNPPQVS